MTRQRNRGNNKPTQREPDTPQAPVFSRQSFSIASWKGPIPPPSILKEYEETLPGTADRILSIAENQSDHRIRLEAAVIGHDARRSLLGLILGFIIALAALGGAVFLIYAGHSVAGLVLAAMDIGGMVAAFVYGTSSRRAERTQKASNLPQVRKS